MTITIILLIFLYLVARGFMRVISYFWNWLAGGEKLDEETVEQEEAAREESEEVLESKLKHAEKKRGRERRFARWDATREAVNEYVDNMKLDWYQLVVIFVISSMGGLLIEEVWRYISRDGLIENRVGLVWGPFSPIYGVGAVILTLMAFELRKHHAKGWQVFLLSMVVGGCLEQFAGWAMETLFHATSWSYLHLPDHITQWVSVRFLFVWGILGYSWFRWIMPRMLYIIGMPTTKRQAFFVTFLAIYLVLDIGMTFACFIRKTARDQGIEASNAFEEWVDENYDDEFITNRFQNLTISSGDEDE